MDDILQIGDWYASLLRVYLWIYGSIKEQHQLPHYVPHKLVFLKIVYQTYVVGFRATMMRKRKMDFPKLPLQVGSYKIENVKQAVEATKFFGVYQFGELPFYRHDLEGLLKKFCKKHSIPWSYRHCTYLEEEAYKRAISLQEVESNIKRKRKES